MPATTDTTKTVDLLVRRDDRRQCRFGTSPAPIETVPTAAPAAVRS